MKYKTLFNGKNKMVVVLIALIIISMPHIIAYSTSLTVSIAFATISFLGFSYWKSKL